MKTKRSWKKWMAQGLAAAVAVAALGFVPAGEAKAAGTSYYDKDVYTGVTTGTKKANINDRNHYKIGNYTTGDNPEDIGDFSTDTTKQIIGTIQSTEFNDPDVEDRIDLGDEYKFQLKKDGKVVITVNNTELSQDGDGDPFCYVGLFYDGTNKLGDNIAYWTRNEAGKVTYTMYLKGVDAGTDYVLGVYPYGEEDMNVKYTITLKYTEYNESMRLEKEPDDSIDDASVLKTKDGKNITIDKNGTKLTYDKMVTGNLYYRVEDDPDVLVEDFDYYKFTVSEKVSQANVKPVVSGTDCNVIIVNDEDEEMDSSKGIYTLQGGEDYFIKVSGDEGAYNSQYSLGMEITTGTVITAKNDKFDLMVGKEEKLEYSGLPEDWDVVFKVRTGGTKASVEKRGDEWYVIGKSVGTAVIRATVKNAAGKEIDEKFPDFYTVNVIENKETDPVTAIDISDDDSADITLVKGKDDSKQLKVTVSPNPTSDTLDWTIGNTAVVSFSKNKETKEKKNEKVGSNGTASIVVYPMGAGTTTVTVKPSSAKADNNNSFTFNVTVKNHSVDITSLDAVSEEKVTMILAKDDGGVELEVAATPENADEALEWSFDNITVASFNKKGTGKIVTTTIDKDGRSTAVIYPNKNDKQGTATITVKPTNTKQTADNTVTFTITVKDQNVGISSMSFNSDRKIILERGKDDVSGKTLSVKVNPDETTSKVKWTITDDKSKSIAFFDKNGDQRDTLSTAVSNGVASIRIYPGSKVGLVHVKAEPENPAEGAEADEYTVLFTVEVRNQGSTTSDYETTLEYNSDPEITLVRNIDKKKDISVKVFPETTSDTITWEAESKDGADVYFDVKKSKQKYETKVKDGIATVSVYPGDKAGTAFVTAYPSSGNSEKGLVFEVTVQDQNPSGITVTITAPNGDTIDGSSGSVVPLDYSDSEYEIEASVSPASLDQTVTWKSSNAGVATIKDGRLKLVGGGTTKITATTVAKPVKTSSFTLNVTVHVTDVVITTESNEDGYALFASGKRATLTKKIYPETPAPSNSNVTWESSDPSVKVLDAKKGIITGEDGADAWITVTSDADKSIKDMIRVKFGKSSGSGSSNVNSSDVKLTFTNDSVSTMKDSDTSQKLYVNVTPSGAAQKVTWDFFDPDDASYATFDSKNDLSCSISGKKNGTAMIFVVATHESGAQALHRVKLTGTSGSNSGNNGNNGDNGNNGNNDDNGNNSGNAVGTTFTVLNNSSGTLLKYRITSSSEVALVGADSAISGNLKLGWGVKHDGATFKITSIDSSAFSGQSGIKTVTLGKYMKTIGAHAFDGCTGITKFTVKSTMIGNVGTGAFTGVPASAKFYVPTSVGKSIRSKFRDAGLTTAAKFYKGK